MNRRIATGFAITMLFILSFSAFAGGDQDGRVKLPDEDRLLPLEFRNAGTMSKASAALTRFADAHPAWQYRLNARTGTPHRAWGDGLRIEGFSDITEVTAPMAAARFIADHSDILAISPASLRLMYARIANGLVYVKYIQQYKGIDVLHAEVDLRMTRDGRVVVFGSDAQRGIDVETVPSLTSEAARAFATAGLDGDPARFTYADGGVFILPLNYDNRTEFRLVRQVTVTTGAEATWETYVDAHDGTVLWRRNLVLNFARKGGGPGGTSAMTAGTIRIAIYPQSWLMGETTVPLPNAYVSIGGTMVTTDADGRFQFDLGGAQNVPVIARLSGPYALARRADTTTNGTTKNALITMAANSGQDILITFDNSNSIASERNVFYHMTRVRNWIRTIDPSTTLEDLDVQLTGICNIRDSCNAFWDGTRLNFFRASQGCGNTGEIADVIYHEFGHGVNTFMYRALKNTSMRSGALGEATADIFANMLLDDPRIGIGFQKGWPNDGIIRNSDNTRRYPENLVFEEHDDGQILTGAVWDVRRAIGLETTAKLAHFAKYGTPDGTTTGEAFADYFIEFLLADDDDGNLANGTPHSADIVAAFMKHGIPASGITILHAFLPDQSASAPAYEMNGSVKLSLSLNTSVMSIQTVRAVYSIDNWKTSATADLALNPSTRAITGSLPQQPAGSVVWYYLEAVDNFGSTSRLPMNAPENAFTFAVDYTSKMLNDGEGQNGWSILTDAVTGEWERADPIGTYNSALGTPPEVPFVQPDQDHTPGANKVRCWVTENGTSPGNLGEADVDDGATTLTSPSIDCTAMHNPILRYYRWYSNNAGATPGTDSWVVRLSSDGGATWRELENTKQSDASWRAVVVRLKDWLTLTQAVRVQFEASDTGEGSLVEAAVDDIEILDTEAITSVTRSDATPGALQLAQNYPNPFNPTTTVGYVLPTEGEVRLTIVNALGQTVATPVQTRQSAGAWNVTFDASQLPSGLYVAVLEFDGMRLSRAMTLLK